MYEYEYLVSFSTNMWTNRATSEVFQCVYTKRLSIYTIKYTTSYLVTL